MTLNSVDFLFFLSFLISILHQQLLQFIMLFHFFIYLILEFGVCTIPPF